MNLVDDHKHELKEYDYMQICNLLKGLYHSHKKKPTNQEMIIQSRTCSPGRVLNEDKFIALCQLFNKHSLRVPYFLENRRHILEMEKQSTKSQLKNMYLEKKHLRLEREKNVAQLQDQVAILQRLGPNEVYQ